jgi:uracil-DNA glycosylase family 4
MFGPSPLKDWRDLPPGKEKYGLYMASREWALIKEAVRARSGGICERCRLVPGENVHHQTYARIYRERLEDLLHVCRPCHEFISGKSHHDPAARQPDRVKAVETPPQKPAATNGPSIRPFVIPRESITSFVDTPDRPLPVGEPLTNLLQLGGEISACVKCPLLASTRTQVVCGRGSPRARVIFIGEAPGSAEDEEGEPFVGKAGWLLQKIITRWMGLKWSDVYRTNVLKSRPPENRLPLPEEVMNCLPFLEREIAIVRPEFICLLGKVATASLLETALPMGKLRGRWHRYQGVPTLATYHPAFVLKNPACETETRDDFEVLCKAMGLPFHPSSLVAEVTQK